jgi:hypothetical protein
MCVCKLQQRHTKRQATQHICLGTTSPKNNQKGPLSFVSTVAGATPMYSLCTASSCNFFKDRVGKPAENWSNIRLASHLVRTPNFYSGGREFDSPGWTRTLPGGVQSCVTVTIVKIGSVLINGVSHIWFAKRKL